LATQAELNARVLRSLQRVGVSSTETTDITSWINETIREDICLAFDWPFMWDTDEQNTSNGDSSYDFGAGAGFTSADFKDCHGIWYRESSTDEWKQLAEESYRTLLAEYAEEASGPPAAWALSAVSATGVASFELRPVPDGTYATRALCSVFPAAISGTSSNYLTARHPRLVEYGTVARALRSLHEDARAQTWEGLFQSALQSAVLKEKRAAGRRFGSMRRSSAAEVPARGTRRSQMTLRRAALDL
jgi:hypothetical protein